MEDDKMHNIFALSDYSLIDIFKYVSSTDLYNLSLTCKRFEGLVTAKNLWYKIDARDGTNTKEKVKYCIDRINEKTTDFLVCSDRRDIQILPDDFFSSDACSKLTVLAIENQIVRGDLAELSQYPKTLVELSLRKSFVNSHSTFFKFSYMQMKNLKVLILDECGWVETYMIVQMSKYPKLEILSMYKCKKLSDNDIAYLSLAGCFGFKELRILDVRFTGLGDQILKTFYKHPTLQELYFQSYVSTYALDTAQRRIEIERGDSVKPHAYLSKYDDIPDNKLDTMLELFGNHRYRTCKRLNLTNHGTAMYRFVVPNVDDDYEVESVLYRSPYGECACGFSDTIQNLPSWRQPTEQITTDSEEILRLKHIIKEEREKKVNRNVYILVPQLQMNPFNNKTNISFYEEQASESNKQIGWINVREPLNLFEISMFEHTDIQSEIISPETRIQSLINAQENNSEDENRRLALDAGVLMYEFVRNQEDRFFCRANCNLPQRRRENENNDNPDVELDQNVDRVDESNKINGNDGPSCSNTIKDGCSNGKNSNEGDISKEETCNSINNSKKDSDLANVSRENSICIETVNEELEKNVERKSLWKKQDPTNKNAVEDAEKEYRKCTVCGTGITDTAENVSDNQNICKICKDSNPEMSIPSSSDIKTETYKKGGIRYGLKINISNSDRNDVVNPMPSTSKDPSASDDINKENDIRDGSRTNNSNQDGNAMPDLSNPGPSTSRDPPAASSAKRKRDSSTNTPIKIKKARKSYQNDAKEAGPSGLQAGINIEVDHAAGPSDKAFYIRIKMPEAEEVEPGLINVPMGGGLINILLGVDTKTKVPIKKLSLRGFPKITDCTLEYLTGLKLELLDITKTGVTKSAVQSFIRKNPTCRVLHESACTCLPNLHF